MFQKTSIEDLTTEDILQIRSIQNSNDTDMKETDRPFEDGDFMEILKRGCDKLDALKRKQDANDNHKVDVTDETPVEYPLPDFVVPTGIQRFLDQQQNNVTFTVR